MSSKSTGSSREEVDAICRSIREILERVLLSAHANPGKAGGDLVRGACLHGAILLKQALEKFAGCTVEVKGGDGLEDGGVLSRDGDLCGHYWLEGLTGLQERFLADITADQFGLPPIILLWPEDSWSRYRAGDQATVTAHVAETLEAYAPESQGDFVVHFRGIASAL